MTSTIYSYEFDLTVFAYSGEGLGIVRGILPLTTMAAVGQKILISLQFSKVQEINPARYPWSSPTLTVKSIITLLAKEVRNVLEMEDLVLAEGVQGEDFFRSCEELFGFQCERV